MIKLLTALIAAGILSFYAIAQAPDTLWTRIFDIGESDYGKCVQQTDDDGYIVLGATGTETCPTFCDVILIKTDADGITQWSRIIADSNNEWGESVQQTTDGGYIITGGTDSYGPGSTSVFLIKTDSLGNTVWDRTYGGWSEDLGCCVQQTFDGGYIITGWTQSFGAGFSDVYLIKTDTSGNEEWSRTFGDNYPDFGHSIRQTLDGGYVITGTTSTVGPYYRLYLLKTDSLGNEEWHRTFGGSGYECGYSVQQTSDGGFIITGSTFADSSGADVYLIKTDSSGNEEWHYSSVMSGCDYGYCVQQTLDGGYIVTGETWIASTLSTNVYVIKTDASGNEEWYRTFGGSTPSTGYSVRQTADRGYIIAGCTDTGSGDVWLIRLANEGTNIDDLRLNPAVFSSFLHNAHPNPFNQHSLVSFTLEREGVIKLAVYDIAGREVARLAVGLYPAGEHQTVFEGWGLANGVYFAQLQAEGFQKTRKMLLIK